MIIKLNEPEPQAISQSLRLIDFIRNKINQSGPIRFEEYMNYALYAPGLGYYSAPGHKIGHDGDFITAPEISPLFAGTLARECQGILAKLTHAVIFELGAGTGSLAADLLLNLESLQSLPEAYWILEISTDLKARQRETILKRCPHLLPKVKWLNALPDKAFCGIIIGNEVIDALPVTRFMIEDDVVNELGVDFKNARFTFCNLPASRALQKKVTAIEKYLGKFAEGYCSEINLLLECWLKSICEHFTRGLILFIDYGYSQSEYYAPHRTDGTLQCYYQHRVHNNPLIYPGLQDITAHVDFTALAQAASETNLQVAGYITQGSFLINCGIEALMQQTLLQGGDSFLLTQQVKKLLSPNAMGENFKVMALTRDFNENLLGFRINSLLFKL